MSTWHVRAIERLGTPLPSWPTIWGPADPGADPIAANGLRTVDLTPHLAPLNDFSGTLECDLTRASFGSVPLDLKDPDESLAVLLGPFSDTLATADRYYGPWIEVTEHWGTTETAVRWTGYLDETSLQWDQAKAITKATVMHASQLLRERRLADLPELLRPYPSTPTTASEAFAQGTGDSVLHDAVPAYAPRGNAAALEAALWTGGQLSWVAAPILVVETEWVNGRPFRFSEGVPLPSAPALSLSIGGITYQVASLSVHTDPALRASIVIGTVGEWTEETTYAPVLVNLSGSPNLTGILTLGATVTWGIAEDLRTHYVLAENVPAPVSGSDGQRWMRFTYVEQLVPGDRLVATFLDSTSGVQRRERLEATVIDVDGETGRVWLKDPLSQALSTASVLKIRRDGRDPVLFDGVALAARAVAPWALDTTYLLPATTARPVLTWLPLDGANPVLHGIHGLASLDRTGSLRLARRGAKRESDGTYPLTGIWEGSWSTGWSWLGSPAASTVAEVLGDLNQWPGGTNTFRPPVLYLNGDLSGGATIPPNGWRGALRTWREAATQTQDLESWWDGAAMQWEPRAVAGLIPSRLVAYAAQTASPGRYIRTSGGAWTFEPHLADATLGSTSTPTIIGALPAGNWLALGMGIWANGDETEALLGLVTPSAGQPFSGMTAALLSQASGGDLTLRQSHAFASGEGAWSLGGGLVVQSTLEYISGAPWPKTTLHRLNGTSVQSATFRTLEIIPQSLQPLSLTGEAGSLTVGGWYALALETYLDEAFAPSRRLRFLWLSSSLTLLNGELEADPADPLNSAARFRRGDVVAELLADGALPCRLVRTGEAGDRMVGFVGGRLFQVAREIPRTIERLAVGEATALGADASGLSVAEYVERLSQALMATAIPDASGNIRLVSRASGPLRVRAFTSGSFQRGVSVKATERSARHTTQAYRGYVSEVRVSYTDALTGDHRQVVVVPGHEGGKPVSLDMGTLVGGITGARAIGEAFAAWFGVPAGVIGETWVDRTGGPTGSLAPTWWADWSIGDLVTFVEFTVSPTLDATPLAAYKILQFKRGPEARKVQVELLRQAQDVTPTWGGA